MNAQLVKYQNDYVAKKALFSLLGSTFRIFDTAGRLQFYIKQKAFKLREEIVVFGDDRQQERRLVIKARSISDFSGGYDITDAQTGESVGGAKRHGFKSFFKDEWSILDAGGSEVGKCIETGGFMILVRKFLKFLPQTYEVTLGGQQVGTVRQRFNPFQLAYDVSFAPGSGFDPRLGVGMVVLLLAIEGGKE